MRVLILGSRQVMSHDLETKDTRRSPLIPLGTSSSSRSFVFLGPFGVSSIRSSPGVGLVRSTTIEIHRR